MIWRKKIPGFTNLLRLLGNSSLETYKKQLKKIEQNPSAKQALYTAVRSTQRLQNVSEQLADDLGMSGDDKLTNELQRMLKDTFSLGSYGLV